MGHRRHRVSERPRTDFIRHCFCALDKFQDNTKVTFKILLLKGQRLAS